MSKENINQKCRLENIDVTRNYFVDEIEHNELMRIKYTKYCTTLNYIEHLLTLLLPFTDAFASLLGIPLGITSSAIGLKIWIITGIKKYKPIIKKKKNNDNEISLRAKTKLNDIEVLISKVLIDSNISHDEFVLINNALKKWLYKKGNQKLKDWNSLSQILVYL